MILLAESDTSRGVPFPELSTEGFDLPRHVFPMGGPPISAYLPKNLVFSVRDGAPSARGLTDFICGVGWLVVSKRLKEVLSAEGAEIEYFPIGLRYRGALHQGYFIANPFHRIKGVDMDASDILLDSVGVAYELNRLVLDETRFSNVPVSVLHETAQLAIQSEVADAVRAALCSGCAFRSPESIHF